ncbi:MAG: hypothetical protein JNJ54_31485 [Myxococcaceae bacterium]|nr:hypothetical protein [Myxococcaceae bacterium]
MKRLFLTFFVCLLHACKPAPEAPQPAAPPAPATVATPDVTAPAAQPRLTRNADGTIRLEFIDRWGKPFDATYEGAEYLRRAVPVVSRGMTEQQATALEKEVASLR